MPEVSPISPGDRRWSKRKLQEAAAAFESALKVNPRMGIAHVNLIAIYGELNLPERAEQHYRDSVRLDPGWVEAQYNWGMFLFRQGRKEEAAEAFTRAVQLNPNYADAQAQLGLALEETGRPEEAEGHYRLALESNPAQRQAQYLLGRSLTRAGRFGEAISYLLETVQVEDVKTPVCMQLLAIAYERAGDLGRAVYYTRQARERAVSLKMHQLAAQLQRDLDRLAATAK
jgi:Tfp pilus assembly protein PilF